MKFQPKSGVTVETVPKETYYRIEVDGYHLSLSREQAEALIDRLSVAMGYEGTAS